MADDAIRWMNQLSIPFFCTMCRVALMHRIIPRQNGIKKISGLHLFDKGWNALRDQIFANQKVGAIRRMLSLRRGLISFSSNGIEATDEEKFYIRQADVYAAFLAYTDHEIGRVIQAVADMGKLENTLIIYISGDNGASGRRLAERHTKRGATI